MRKGCEFDKIKQTFFTTMDESKYEITEIMRLQNVSLWKNYDRFVLILNMTYALVVILWTRLHLQYIQSAKIVNLHYVGNAKTC